MPGRDRTGPNGIGSRTGRALGECAGNETALIDTGIDYRNGRGQGFGRRNGQGRGMGRGQAFGNGYGFRNTNRQNIEGVKERTLVENEINILKDQLVSLEDRLKNLKD